MKLDSLITVLKQLVLKPQDLVVALKVTVNSPRDFILATLSEELGMVISAVHGSVNRCEQARLLSRVAGGIRPNRGALLEFTVHGARYAFPAVLGTLTRGSPTSLAGPSLREFFDQDKALSPVWPDSRGEVYGPGLVPLHHTVPEASRRDGRLYDVLTLLDAVRVGAAREREIAIRFLEERLS